MAALGVICVMLEEAERAKLEAEAFAVGLIVVESPCVGAEGADPDELGARWEVERTADTLFEVVDRGGMLC